jgi:hypothetical protein
MAGLRVHLEHGPETVLVSENMVGGTFVEPDPGNPGKVRKTVVNSTTVLGCVQGDAAAVTGMVAAAQDEWGRYNAGQLKPPNETALLYRGSWWLRNSTGAPMAFGSRVFAGAGGTMVATGTGPAVGIVIEPGGIAAGAEGRVRLTIR